MVTKNKVKGNDIPPSYYERLASIESSGNPLAQASTSSASGLYQFTEGTWKEMVEQLGLDYTLEDRFDPDKSLVVVKQFTQKNKDYLERSLGRNVTENELYLSHFLGMGGSRKMLETYEQFPSLTADRVLSPNAIKSNPSVFLNKDGSVKTLGEIYKWSEKKFGVEGVKPKEDEGIWSMDEEGNYITLNPDYANDLDKMISDNVKQRFLSEQYPTKTVEEETIEEVPQWKLELEQRQQERDTVLDFVNRGGLDMEAIDYNRAPVSVPTNTTQFQDGGTKEEVPTEVYYGTPEYEQAYKEGRLQGQELDEVVITADKKTGKNILEEYPFYNTLSPQEREYFRDNSPIGTQVRARARDGRGVTADKASAMGAQLLQGAISAMQTPQSVMVEGVEAMRGNEYDFSSTLPGNNQRVPSDAWGYENPEGFLQNAANMGMDIVLDPLNIVGGGAAKSGLQQGTKKGLTSSAKQKSLQSLKGNQKIENSLDNSFDILENLGLKEPKGRLAKANYVPLTAKLKSELRRALGVNEKSANKWQKDWYNHPETLEKLNDAEEVFKEALKDGRVQGKNPFTEIKDRIKNKEYQGQEVKRGTVKEEGSYSGISGYNLLENQPKGKRVNLAVSDPKRESKDIISTLIHEGNHGVTDGNKLIPSYYQDDMIKMFGKDATLPKRNTKTGQFESVKDYIKTPTEIYARIMQIRKDFGLKPDQEVTEDMVKEFLSEIKKGKTKINKSFATDIKDTKKLAEVMNYLPAVVPAVGAGVMTAQNTTISPQQFQDGGQVAQRKGVRENKDGTESTHLMRRERLEDGTWVAFPSLFQNEKGDWVDLGEKYGDNWKPIYEYALKIGEVYNFGEDEEAAINFADKGSWKNNNYKDGGKFPISSKGLYDYPNQPVVVPTKDGKITMKGIDYPVLGIANTGEEILMQPNKEYHFKGATEVLEIPVN